MLHVKGWLSQIRTVTVILLVLLLAGCAPVEDRPPNIVLVMADDLGYETLGVNGSTSYETPRLDALAAQGMRFTQAFAMPLCTPSRVQIMTGRYNFRNYIGFGLLNPDETTFAHLLKDAGYRTGIVGKWQLWGNARQRELFGRNGTKPYDAGFDEYCLWQIEEKFGSRFKDPYLEIDGRSVEFFEGGYGPNIFADYAEDFFERHQDEPFFLYFPMVLTHDPFQPVPGDSMYTRFEVTDRFNDAAYFASNVAYMDAIVGRLIDKIEDLDLADNTLFLFTGDNGTDRDVTSQTVSGEIRGNKGYTPAAGTHVPLIAYWPTNVDPGQVNSNLIDFTDFLPTLLEAAGASAPEGHLLDGLSFYPQLVTEADTVRQWIFCHYSPQWGDFQNHRYAQSRDWKLYENGSLIHLPTDQLEERSLDFETLNPEEKREVEMLRAVLASMPGGFETEGGQ